MTQCNRCGNDAPSDLGACNAKPGTGAAENCPFVFSHLAVPSGDVPDGVHSGDAGVSAPSAGGSEPLDVEGLIASMDAARERRARQMPTENHAIRAMFAAFLRLKELGWRDGRHMPTTGERHAGIQCGSTGIHAYTAEKPNGPLAQSMYYIHDGDLWATRVPPVLFRVWKDTDVQPSLRICAPIPNYDAAPASSALASGATTVNPARQGAEPNEQGAA